MLYDVLFLTHIVSAIVIVVVLVSMKLTAAALVRSQGEKARLPRGRNWAARILHLLPLTGFAIAWASNAHREPISLDQLWITVGIVTYLLAGALLEMIVLPAEHELVVDKADSVAAKKMSGALDGVMTMIVIGTIAMLLQFG
jgi:hypothetical protein